jgi:hypothetical protein
MKLIFPVVAIRASALGLRPLEQFLGNFIRARIFKK